MAFNFWDWLGGWYCKLIHSHRHWDQQSGYMTSEERMYRCHKCDRRWKKDGTP